MQLENIGREGLLRLTFEKRAGRTALVENYSRPPLQVMRAIPDVANCLCVYLLSPTGGVVQGDRYHINLCAGDEAHALFTTQSATKVYRMPQGFAEQVIEIDVGRNAVFEFVPDAAILFADADLRQTIEVNLQPGGLALLHEIVMPGRVAMGEHLRFRRYVNRLIVRDAAGLIIHDTADIQPAQMDLTALGRLEGSVCWGSAYLGGALSHYQIDPLAFCSNHHNLVERHGALASLTPLYREGLCLRVLADRLETIYQILNDFRSLIRTQYLHLPDAPLRK